MNFRHMTLQARLAAAFALLALLVAVISATALAALARERSGFEHYTAEVAPRLDLAREVLAQSQARAEASRELLLAASPKERQAAVAAQAQAQQGVADALTRLRQLLSREGISPQERNLFAGVEAVEALYAPLAQSIATLATDGQREQALERLNGRGRAMQASLAQAVRDYRNFGNAQAAEAEANADAAYALSRNLLLAGCAMALALAAVLALRLPPALTRELGGEPAEE